MRVNSIGTPVSSVNQNKNKTNFGAMLLKDNVTLTDKRTGKPVKASIIELETEYRELLADRRMRHHRDIPCTEFKERVDNIYKNAWDTVIERRVAHEKLSMRPLHHETYADVVEEQDKQKMENNWLQSVSPAQTREDNTSIVQILDELVRASGEKPYKGDYEFMNALAENDGSFHGLIKDINGRLQPRYDMPDRKFSWMSKYLGELTNGQRKVMPKGGYGMLNRDYGDFVTYSEHSPIDSMIYADTAYGTDRQRILMAVEPQADGNYRNLKPETRVYGVAEVFTDRAMDAVEDMAADEEKRMAEIIKVDEEFDRLYKQYLDGGKTDKELGKKLDHMAFDICNKYHIKYSDFMMISQGKSYIKSNDEIGKQMLETMGIPEEKTKPIFINRLFSYCDGVDSAEKALLDTILQKGRFRGVVASWWCDIVQQTEGFRNLYGFGSEKVIKEGFMKLKQFR